MADPTSMPPPGFCIRRLPEPVLFGLVAATTTLIDVLAFWLLTRAGAHPIGANVVSYGGVAALNYGLNARVTFAHRGVASSGLGSMRRILAFAGVKVVTLAISTLSLAAAMMWLEPLAAKGVAIIATFSVSFLLSSRLVFLAGSTGTRMS